MNRRGYVVATSLAVLGAALTAAVSLPPKLLWNASASTPVGLYALHPAHDLRVGDLVAVTLPRPLADFMVGRGYIGRGVPLLKHIAARPGQEICRAVSTVSVDGAPLGDALDRDTLGRSLPVWQGCRRLGTDELFLMNSAVRDSFDGRYFGPIAASSVIGRATPLYTDADGSGRFAWQSVAR